MNTDARLLPCGDLAVLVEVPDLHAVLSLDATIRGRLAADEAWSTVLDVVPAARTLLVTVGSPGELAGVREALTRLIDEASLEGELPADGHEVEIPVRYDGPDLEDVSEATGLSRDEIVAAHTGITCRVGFAGFAPGFAYLVDGDPRLEVPRRATPRTKVPAGAVGLAGTYSGVYPRSSPGGWQIIGTTDAVLWDVDRDPPALLRPGVVVRFVEEGLS